MNGMNLINSSPIIENNDEISVIEVMASVSTVPGLTIPNISSILPTTTAYIIYPAKRATARPMSRWEGFLNISL